MLLQQTLTKENFWNEIMVQYPKSTKTFCEWIDAYKAAVSWDTVFNIRFPGGVRAAKFHEIPYEMQQGIWITFARETLDKFFEQPEYTYSFDLGEDIKMVFGEIEDLIDEEEMELS